MAAQPATAGAGRRADHGAHPRQTAPDGRHELDHPVFRQSRDPQPGLTLFLAQVGMASGPKFAATVTETGLVMLGLGAMVLVALVLPILILGLLFFRMPFDEVAGIVAGACGNPAILAYSNKLTPTDRPDIGYAMIFPGMTIVKILFVDIVPAFF